jgi:hypothetical protein
MAEILLTVLVTIISLVVGNKLLNDAFAKIQKAKETEVIIKTFKVPLFIKYTQNKDMFYAWDLDDTFVGQSPNKEELLTNISKRFNIPKDKLYIETESLL